MDRKPLVVSTTFSGLEDSDVIRVVLGASALDAGESIVGFTVATLPAGGVLYLDATMLVPVVAGQFIEANAASLDLFFRPAADFNGQVSFAYTATESGAVFEAAAAQRYFLSIDGINAGGVTEGREAAFGVSSFRVDIESLMSLSGGGGAGKLDPGPLEVTLEGAVPVDLLIDRVAGGKLIAAVRLEGVRTDADGMQTVYDLRLSDVAISDISDGSGGTQLALTYEALSLTTRGIDAQGRLGPEQTVSWDATSGEVGRAPLVPPDTQVAATPAIAAGQYYLTVDGLGGSSVVKGHEGAFAVEDFEFDITFASVSGSGGGGGAGKATPGPLVVRLAAGEAMNGLVDAVARGKVIPLLRLEGVTVGDEASRTVYDLRLEDVLVTRVEDGTGAPTLELSYRKVSLTIAEDSTKGGERTVSWDTSTGSVGTAPLDAADPAPAVSASAAQQFYLTVDGIDGGVMRDGFQGAFALEAFDFEITSTGSWSGAGSGAGKPQPGPLRLDLQGDAALTPLIGSIASGSALPLVRVQGVIDTEGGAQTVYDLRLADVRVSRVVDANGGDQLELVYGALSLTTRGVDASGRLGPQQTVSWDVASASVGTDPLDEARAGTGGDGAAAAATDYFLTLDGIGGGSVAPNHEGAFAIAGFELDIESALGSLRGGSATSAPQAGPLTLTLEEGSPLLELMARAARGTPIPLARLEGVVEGTGEAQTVYDLRLSELLVTRIETGSGEHHLELAFSAISLTTTTFSVGGKAGESTTVSWDLATGDVGSKALDPADSGNARPVSPATAHFLVVDGMNGGVLERGHEGAFEVAGFQFDISQVLAGATGGGGSGAGKPLAGPLVVELDPGAGLGPFIAAAASGEVIPLLRLEGVVSIGGQSPTVYDLRLADVRVRVVEDAAGGADRIEFDYEAMSLTTRGQDETGKLLPPATFSWNVASATIGTTPLDAADAAPGAITPVEADAWFLTIDGLAGGVVQRGLEGSFAVEDFSFLVESAVATAGGTGKAVAGPLELALQDGAPMAALLGVIASGKVVPLVRLQGVIDGEPGMRTVYDLRLADVHISRISDGDGSDMLQLSYSAMSLTTRGLDGKGGLGPETTVSWDVLGARVGDDALDVAQPRLSEGGLTSDPGTITIDVTPVNDPAVIGGDTSGSIIEDAMPAVVTGQLTVTDIDSPASFASVDAPQASEQGHGHFTVTADGQWTYLLDNLDLAVDLLSSGQTLTDTFAVSTADGTSQLVTLTIHGVSDSGNVIVAAEGQAAVRGSAGADTVLVDPGNRLVTAGGGDDRFIVEPPSGRQLLVGGRGDDTVDFRLLDEGVQVDLRRGFATSDGGAVVHLTSVENAAGGAGNDTLAGDAGGNLLDGRGGDDVLRGRGGVDTLVGGAGADTFVFDDGDSGATAARRDLILDFEPGVDRIDLSRIDAVQHLPGDQAFRAAITSWNGSGQPFAPNTAGRIAWHHEVIDGVTWTVIDLNTDRDAAADVQIALRGLFTFDGTGDFLL